MKTNLLIALLLFVSCNLLFSQNSKEYQSLVGEAMKYYESKDYLKAGNKFDEAFKSNENKGYIDDRYNAACCWALASIPDSAFSQLYIISNKGKFTDYDQLISDADLKNLYSDKRWTEIKKIVKANREKAEANMDKKLKAELEKVFADDQKYRDEIGAANEKYGWGSKEVDSIEKALKPLIKETDSINLGIVLRILEKYGWLGTDVVGELGNSTLWAVIQHADLKTQEIYLPKMREAAKEGKARRDQLALLEDRVALRQGRKQIYGSQICGDPVTKIAYVCPLENPDNVNIRRAEVGLEPLEEYLKNYQLTWDAEQYKKDLPAIEALEKGKLK
jgi:hypothetical protein